jgi:hypothetical protein
MPGGCFDWGEVMDTTPMLLVVFPLPKVDCPAPPSLQAEPLLLILVPLASASKLRSILSVQAVIKCKMSAYL